MNTRTNSCPQCGSAIPAEAPKGLCPKCLLAAVSAPTETGEPSDHRPPPPSLELVAAAFPQLRIVELIGQGGMGVVFKARQPKLDRFVALKILPQKLAEDAAFAERFSREGRVLARLSHPNIVGVHDFGQANGFFYLLMEFVDGVNLRQAMKAGRFTPEQALAVVPKICEALQYAHNEGVLHRDIKPENILLDAKGRVKIADFGIAKLIGEPHADCDLPGSATHAEVPLTGSGAAIGTPHYMAPEQIEHPSEVDHRADIYSLGVVFYEMLTGELPLGRFAPPSEKSAADPRLDDVVLRALAKEPERRTQSAGEVKTQLETIASHDAVPAKTAAGWSKIIWFTVSPLVLGFVLVHWLRASFISRSPAWTFAAVAVVAIVAMWLGAVLWRYRCRAGQPSTTPPWIDRAGWLFVLYGLLPMGWSLGVWKLDQRLSIDLNWLLALTGIALWTRSNRWRKAALISNGAMVMMMAIVIIATLAMTLSGMIPEDHLTSQRMLTTSMMQMVGSVLGFVASFWILNRADVKMLFHTGQWRGSPDERTSARSWPRVHLIRGAVSGLLIFLLIAGGTALVTFLLPKTYQANALIVLGSDQDVATRNEVALAEIEKRLVSIPVLSRVATDLNLKERWAAKFAMNELSDAQVRQLLRRTVTWRLRNRSNIFDVMAFSPVPAEAAEIANAVAEVYCAMDKRVRVIDRAETPTRPVRPRAAQNIVSAILLGGFLGIGGGGLIGWLSLRKSRRREQHAVALRPARPWLKAALAVLLLAFLLGGVLVVPNLIKQNTPVPLPQPIGQSPNALAVKTVELTRVARVGDDVLTISAGCESDLFPGEALLAFLRYPDGRMEDATTTSTLSRTPNGHRTYTSFIWRLPTSFSSEEAAAAITQFRESAAERPLTLMPSAPFTLFSATNSMGRIVEGCLEFKRSLPERLDERAEGRLGIIKASELPHGIYVQVSLEAPPGWALQAAVNGCAQGRADTTSDHSLYQNAKRFVWFLPASYAPENVQAGVRQLETLGEQGVVKIVAGETRLLFSVTNSAGEIYRGLGELRNSHDEVRTSLPKRKGVLLPQKSR